MSLQFYYSFLKINIRSLEFNFEDNRLKLIAYYFIYNIIIRFEIRKILTYFLYSMIYSRIKDMELKGHRHNIYRNIELEFSILYRPL